MSTPFLSTTHPRTARMAAWPLIIAAGLFLLMLLFAVWLLTLDMRGEYHLQATTADVDGDGDLDVLLAGERRESELTLWKSTSLWANEGGGRFVPAQKEWYVAGAAGGDLDGDGLADLALLEPAPARLQILLNPPGSPGAFPQNGPSFAPGGSQTIPGAVLLGDLNGDARLDAFITGCCSMLSLKESGEVDFYIPSYAWAWINATQPGSRAAGKVIDLSSLGDLRMRDAALGDLDGDGDLDLFAAVLSPKVDSGGEPGGRVMLNDGAGHFTDSGQRLGEEEALSVALGDVDADGDLDALLGTASGAVLWVNGGGNGHAQPGIFNASPQRLSSGAVPFAFLADFDVDGDLDALTGGRRSAGLWLNDGQGAFTRSSRRFPYSPRYGLAVGDFNGDALPDIFTASYPPRAYNVWLNAGGGEFIVARP